MVKVGGPRGRLCKPNPPLVRVCLPPPPPPRSPRVCSRHRQSSARSERSAGDSSKAARASGARVGGTQKRIPPTDLSAPGEVEVDEIVAERFSGQAKEAFICDPAAVGYTQVLEVPTAPV